MFVNDYRNLYRHTYLKVPIIKYVPSQKDVSIKQAKSRLYNDIIDSFTFHI